MLKNNQIVASITKAKKAIEIEQIQALWSGYGMISRYLLTDSKLKTVIVKNIVFPNQNNHPKGWNTNISHQRKVKSYQVETEWYKSYSKHCNAACKVPLCFGIKQIEKEQIIVLEDLDGAGFSLRKSSLSLKEVKLCLKWLANFHATFLNVSPKKIWQKGSYWHLSTRPDEFKAMQQSKLKDAAKSIDKQLNNCKYKTLIHGDAKVANFCFADNMSSVAAVDFQYVGSGCGIKDVAYLFSSCLSENECKIYEKELLLFYFNELKSALNTTGKQHNFNELEAEYRFLYAFAWADFTRFLMGWMPSHHKINSYSKIQVEKTLKLLI